MLEESDTLQHLVDYLYRERKLISRLDALTTAEIFDLNSDLLEIVTLLPPGTYSRPVLCNQLNSAIVGHGWGSTYGTVS